jgi:hypothetical protein
MKVRKGSIVTNILDKNLNKYLAQGWKIVEDAKPFESYTEDQLKDIVKSKGLIAETKEDAIQMLEIITTEEQVSNEGFTDGLIKDIG